MRGDGGEEEGGIRGGRGKEEKGRRRGNGGEKEGKEGKYKCERQKAMEGRRRGRRPIRGL